MDRTVVAVILVAGCSGDPEHQAEPSAPGPPDPARAPIASATTQSSVDGPDVEVAPAAVAPTVPPAEDAGGTPAMTEAERRAARKRALQDPQVRCEMEAFGRVDIEAALAECERRYPAGAPGSAGVGPRR